MCTIAIMLSMLVILLLNGKAKEEGGCMTRTGVFVTTEEMEVLEQKMKEFGKDEMKFRRYCHNMALGKGLPSVQSLYGVTIHGEFVHFG